MINAHEVVLVHVAEIYLKSPYVKRYFQKVLLSRLVDKLHYYQVPCKVLGWQHHTCVLAGRFTEGDLRLIADTFGVSYVAPAYITETNFASIRSSLQEIRSSWKEQAPASYRILAKKDKKLKLSHFSVEYEAAYYFQDWKVNLKKPEVTFHIDLKTDRTAIYYQKIPGAGGLPYGTQGKILALVSKGIDSPVAAYLLAKRGCEVILLHFGSDPMSDIQNVLQYYAGKPIKSYTMPHYPLLSLYKEHFPEKYRCLFCKMSMVSIAAHIAKQIRAKAIAMGDNLGQVASQTLDNILQIQKATDMPVLRPLIGFDKQEIIDLSKRIGFFPFFENTTCSFVPNEPATKINNKKYVNWVQQIQFDDLIQQYLTVYWKKP